jgi:hypothetical protein
MKPIFPHASNVPAGTAKAAQGPDSLAALEICNALGGDGIATRYSLVAPEAGYKSGRDHLYQKTTKTAESFSWFI